MKEHFRINIPSIIVITVIFVLAAYSLIVAEETLTVTTYYPSPYGSYYQLTTTGNTTLANTTGSFVWIGNFTSPPTTAKLAVNGTVLIDAGVYTTSNLVCWNGATLGHCLAGTFNNVTGNCGTCN